eukprot:3001883-Amphidinium_carterae.1
MEDYDFALAAVKSQGKGLQFLSQRLRAEKDRCAAWHAEISCVNYVLYPNATCVANSCMFHTPRAGNSETPD